MRNIGLTWVEVDIDAIRHNTKQVLSLLKEETKLMAVVKADGYGHGALDIAEACLGAGASYIGVSTLEEGIELRRSGIDAPILIFNPGIGEEADMLIKYDLTVTLASMKTAETLSHRAYKLGEDIKAHLKIETGFARGGVFPEESVDFMKKIENMGNFDVEGVYTQFATADEKDKSYAYEQLGNFQRAVEALEAAGFKMELKHVCNSAAMLDMPEAHLDMVRVGNLIYGQYPSSDVSQKLDLKNTWELKSTVMFVREYQRSQVVGYGAEARTKKGMVLATLPIGFSDGFTLLPESIAIKPTFFLKRMLTRFGMKAKRSVGPIEIKGQATPIVGRVAMQHTTVDVTQLFNITPGDVATVAARRTSINSRVPKVYVKDGHPYKAVTYNGIKLYKGERGGEGSHEA
jgi:alanine racemase